MKKETVDIKVALQIITTAMNEKAYDKAEKLLDEILEQAPLLPVAHFKMGLLKYYKKQLASATIFLKHCLNAESINIRANSLRALFNIYSEIKDNFSALKYLKQAIELQPKDIELHQTFLYHLYLKKDFHQAIEYIHQYADLFASHPKSFTLIGLIYSDFGDYMTATTYFSKAYQANPKAHEPIIYQSFIYKQTGQHQLAIELITHYLSSNQENALLYSELAFHYSMNHEMKKAYEAIKKAFEINPKSPEIVSNYHRIARYSCEWDDVDTLTPLLDTFIDEALTKKILAPERPWMNITRSQNKSQNYQIAENAIEHYIIPRVQSLKRFRYEKSKTENAQKKIRLGYFSNDFRAHATMHLIGDMFAYHDKSQFEIYIFSFWQDEPNDPYLDKIKQAADQIFFIPFMNIQETANLIYKHHIDILIDLKGYTTGAKTEVIALKPAPIIIQYLGYPGTMGADFYDYIITDKIVTPVEDTEYYSEKFIYLPHSYQMTDNTQNCPVNRASRTDFDLPDNKIILGSFNQSFKIEKICFETWLEILAEHDDVILWLYEPDEAIRKTLISFAKKHNGQAHKLYFAEHLPREQHLARLALVDIILDTFTCNGHTTTSDALWMNVPVITLKGEHFPSRVSASLLTALDVPELITSTITAYKTLIHFYINNTDALINMKEKIKFHQSTQALFQSRQQVHYLEKAYQTVYYRYSQGMPNEHVFI
jgi:protein O-GlcNAc transferase